MTTITQAVIPLPRGESSSPINTKHFSLQLVAPKETFAERLTSLIATMEEKTAICLPEERVQEVVEMVQDWRKEFFAAQHFTSPHDEERLKAGDCLFWLYEELAVELPFASDRGEEAELMWGEFLFEFKKLLGEILPESHSLEEFIENSRVNSEKEQLLELFNEIDEEREELYRKGNEKSEEIEKRFEEMKIRVQGIFEKSSHSHENVRVLLKGLEEKIDQTYREMGGVVTGLNNVKALMEERERELSSTVQSVEKVIGRI